MDPETEALKARTKKFALDVLDFVDTLPTRGSAMRIGSQLTDSATSVAANYRAACRSRSDPEFASKIGLVLEEADESLLWLEVITERSSGLPSSAVRGGRIDRNFRGVHDHGAKADREGVKLIPRCSESEL